MVPTCQEIAIVAGQTRLAGTFTGPFDARGLILFAHGSGSSRHSPRNRHVANVLVKAGFATLLMDLLTQDEERVDAITGHLRFDIRFLANRLVEATKWATRPEAGLVLQLGYFGASTGAAAALVAASQRPAIVKAVVSRGGRPDLAGDCLGAVRAPTLLIVGGQDDAVLRLNRDALEKLGTVEKKLEIVPGAGHLFEEPGALEEVANLACDWFKLHLSSAVSPSGVESNSSMFHEDAHLTRRHSS